MSNILNINDITAYADRVATIPLLTKEEEFNLAMRVKLDNCQESAYTLIISNLGFVIKIAREFQRSYDHVIMMDLVQEGNMGMLRALKTYDPERGIRFIWYAVSWIKSYIQTFIIKTKNITSGFSREKRKQLFNKNQESSKIHNDISIDNYDHLKAPEDVANNVEAQLITYDVQKELSDISDKDMFVIEHRIISDTPLSFQEIGDSLGISKEGARQLTERIKKRLKKKFESNKRIMEYVQSEAPYGENI